MTTFSHACSVDTLSSRRLVLPIVNAIVTSVPSESYQDFAVVAIATDTRPFVAQSIYLMKMDSGSSFRDRMIISSAVLYMAHSACYICSGYTQGLRTRVGSSCSTAHAHSSQPYLCELLTYVTPSFTQIKLYIFPGRLIGSALVTLWDRRKSTFLGPHSETRTFAGARLTLGTTTSPPFEK